MYRIKGTLFCMLILFFACQKRPIPQEESSRVLKTSFTIGCNKVIDEPENNASFWKKEFYTPTGKVYKTGMGYDNDSSWLMMEYNESNKKQFSYNLSSTKDTSNFTEYLYENEMLIKSIEINKSSRKIWFYNEMEKCTLSIKIEGLDTVSIAKYTFDTLSRLEQFRLFRGNELVRRREYKYPEKDITIIESYKSTKSIPRKEVIEYNSDKKVVEERLYDEDSNVLESTKYTYDAFGNEVVYEEYEKKKLVYKEETFYSDQNEFKQRVSYNENGEVISRSINVPTKNEHEKIKMVINFEFGIPMDTTYYIETKEYY